MTEALFIKPLREIFFFHFFVDLNTIYKNCMFLLYIKICY